jgi:hypothetical protein
MIQMMRGYEDNLQELKGIGWHYMVANRPESEWQVGPLSGPVSGIWCA